MLNIIFVCVMFLLMLFFPTVALQPNSMTWLPFMWFCDHTNWTPHLVGLHWTSDQPSGETSTWQYTTLTRDEHPCPQWDSNPQSLQVRGLRPRGHWDRPFIIFLCNLIINWVTHGINIYLFFFSLVLVITQYFQLSGYPLFLKLHYQIPLY